MEQFKFHELVIGIIVGDVKEGNTFKTSSGSKVIYKDGALAWVTQAGYLSSFVSVTKEIIEETFFLESKMTTKDLSFSEAMQYLAEGDEVTLTVEGRRSYTLTRLEDMDDIIEDKEFFKDVYKADFTVRVEESQTTTSHKPIGFDTANHTISYDSILVNTGSGTLGAVSKCNGKVDSSLSVTSDSYSKKLTRNDAWSILHSYHFSKVPVVKLAQQYGVSDRMIYYVIDGTHWTDVHEEFHADYCMVKDDYRK